MPFSTTIVYLECDRPPPPLRERKDLPRDRPFPAPRLGFARFRGEGEIPESDAFAAHAE